jgi:DNA-binding MarR family transcriptional regulator|tara:strand:- start:2283 stop:2579 length:297 start_codon:yes stop_codon:yes gene_type:complete
MSDSDSKRDAKKVMRDLRIITAISLGKNRNKDLAKVLDTDKSFASKRVKELEEQGLIRKEGEGRDVRYEVNEFNVFRFLQSKVVIKWGKEKEKAEDMK